MFAGHTYDSTFNSQHALHNIIPSNDHYMYFCHSINVLSGIYVYLTTAVPLSILYSCFEDRELSSEEATPLHACNTILQGSLIGIAIKLHNYSILCRTPYRLLGM